MGWGLRLVEPAILCLGAGIALGMIGEICQIFQIVF